MKLAFVRLNDFFGYSVCTLQQIADNTSLSTAEILGIDSVPAIRDSEEFKAGLNCTDKVQAKINGAGKVQY